MDYASLSLAPMLIWLPLIGPLDQITRAVSPSAEGLALAEQLAYEVPRQVANVHLIVNLSTVLILLPFVNLLAALIVRVTGQPMAPEEEELALAPALNKVLFEMPPMAVDAVRRESLHLGERVADQLDDAVRVILDDQPAAIDALHERELLIDRHYASIVGFVEQLLQPELPADVIKAAVELVEAADYLESIGDLVDKEMISLYQRHKERGTVISRQARAQLQTLAAAVSQELRRALGAVADADQALARAVLETKPHVRSLERAAIEFQLEPQTSDAPPRPLPTALERALTESLRRAYSLTRRFVRVGAGLVHMPAQDA
jgi:phosphate:Na+ symporter